MSEVDVLAALTGENPLQATVDNLRRLLSEAADTVRRERTKVARLRERDRQWETAMAATCERLAERLADEGACIETGGTTDCERYRDGDGYDCIRCQMDAFGAPPPLEETS